MVRITRTGMSLALLAPLQSEPLVQSPKPARASAACGERASSCPSTCYMPQAAAVQLHLHEARETRRDWMAQQRRCSAEVMPLSPTAGVLWCEYVSPALHHQGRFGEVGDAQMA
jgi:hypothetical protein